MEDYAQKNGFTNIRHFTDDGVRGTTFKRPGLDATALVASEKLYPHLAETDRAARDMLDYLMPRLAREAGATETLKAADPMKWVGLMNNCKARAEEIVMHELIYV